MHPQWPVQAGVGRPERPADLSLSRHIPTSLFPITSIFELPPPSHEQVTETNSSSHSRVSPEIPTSPTSVPSFNALARPSAYSYPRADGARRTSSRTSTVSSAPCILCREAPPRAWVGDRCISEAHEARHRGRWQTVIVRVWLAAFALLLTPKLDRVVTTEPCLCLTSTLTRRKRNCRRKWRHFESTSD
jgi:hypothetical protein